MKNFKQKILIALVILALVASTALAAGKSSSQMVQDYGGEKIQVMAPPATSPVITIAGAGNVDVSSYRVIKFSADLDIYWGSDSSNVWPYTAGEVIGISPGVATIHVSAACKMLVM